MQEKTTRNIGHFFEYIGLFALILFIWILADKNGNLNSVIFPSFKKIMKTLFEYISDGTLLKHCAISLSRVLKGYFLAVTAGIILGIFIGLSNHLERITKIFIQIIKPIPPIAWIPLVILWFGLGESGKVFIIFLGGFFTILINVIDGIHQTDTKLIEVSKILETPWYKKIFLIVIPSASANIFTGLRTGLTSCWMCVVAAELISSTTGLGFMIMNARQYGRTDVVIVGMIIIGLIGKIMDSILYFAEKKVIRWK